MGEKVRNTLLAPGGSSAASSRLAATLTELIDVMDIAMWELDRDYRVVGYNRKAEEIYGTSVLGKFCHQAAAGIDQVCDDCPAEQVFAGQPSGRSERQRTRVSGDTIHIDHIATPIRDKDGEITGTLVLIVDITRHKEQELELLAHRDRFEQTVIERTRDLEESQERYRQLYEESSRNEALYRSLLNAAADAIAITDGDGLVRLVNPSFTRLFGWSLAEVAGRRLPFARSVEGDPASGEFRQVMEEGRPISHLLTKRVTRAGVLLDVSVSIARYEDHLGKPAGIICSYRDVTEAKAMELQLYRAQKFEALGTMASGIAHDFNNLLMGIQGSASLMLFELQAGGQPFNPEKLHNIEQYVDHGGNLTKQLLTLAKGNQAKIRTVDPNLLLTGCANLFGRSRRDIVIENRLQEGVWPVAVDVGQIEQVLFNLFVNAAHAMPTGGELVLGTENTELDRSAPLPSGLMPGRYVRITVTDSGCGIDPQILDRIFDPFFTTKGQHQGTGLGLATAYSIISHHGGFIQAENMPEGGARFTLLLPAADGLAEGPSEQAADCLPGNETILLVDDDAMVLTLTREILEHLGYTVLLAGSGEEALRVFADHRGRIDLAIVDLIMPKMNGTELVRRLREQDPHLKVLLCSGYDVSDQAIGSDFLDDHIIQKPFTVQKLSIQIRQILSGGA